MPQAIFERTMRAVSVVAALFLLLAAESRADLAAYVAEPDAGAGWRKVAERADGALRVTEVELVSQSWRGEDWKHELRIFRPETARAADLAVLFISGAPAGWRKSFDFEQDLALASGVPVAVLSDVPNQPLFFGKREDDLLAHTFVQFLKSGEADWPLLLPMTKSATRALDAVAEISAEQWGGRISRFVVTGASKRGWTAWLAAAVDPRIVGIAPVVFDNLNLPAQMKHQVDTWGAYSDQLEDYTLRGLQKYVGTPRGRELVDVVDPYSHRERLGRVRKLVVNGTNDPYWALDAIRFYWHELEGEKSVLYVPNGSHSIADDDRVGRTTAAFVGRIGRGEPMPTLTLEAATVDDAVTATVRSDEDPRAVRLWVARADDGDFRKARFEAVETKPADGAFHARLERDQPMAFVAEADYGDGDERFSLSTPMRVERIGGASD